MENFEFDLQRFAAEGGTEGNSGSEGSDGGDKAGEGANGGKGTESGKNGDSEGAGKPDAEREAEVQKRIEKAVTEAVEKARKEYQKKAEEERRKAEQLSRLSEEERRKAELEAKEQELAAKEKEYQRNVLKLEMVKVLTERNIPVEFMDYFITEDSETTLKRITDFEKAYKKAVKDAVDEKLKGTVPPAGSNGGKPDGNGEDAGVKNGFFDTIYKNQSKR